MVYGAILDKGEEYYTYLRRVFQAIKNVQQDYNWLVSYPDCFPCTPEYGSLLAQNSCWLSGEALTDMIEKEDFLWVWGVLSGFPKDIPAEKVLEYPLPVPDSPKLWKLPLATQHPLAEIEIVPWDSSLVLLFSKRNEIVEDFRAFFPLSRDLELEIESFNTEE